MARRTSAGTVLMFVGALQCACGGVSQSSPSGSGGAASGGSASHAGASNGGRGGQPAVPECELPQVQGTCEAAIKAFWHNPATGVCEGFVYGGCGGNGNRYPSREACQRACKGSTEPDWTSCSADAECTLANLGCCGGCGDEDDRSLVAINADYASKYSANACPSPVSCGACPEPAELTDTDKYYRAACREATCTVEDIRTSPITECGTKSDCVVRDGARCCGGCDGHGFVAVNRRRPLCETEVDCDACASTPPPYLDSTCTEGRCQLVQTPL